MINKKVLFGIVFIMGLILLLGIVVFAESSNQQPSVDCTSWFDGCNTCEVVDGELSDCTKIGCSDLTREKPRCLEYSNQQPSVD